MPCETSIRSELLRLLPKVGYKLSLGRAALNHLLWLIAWTRPTDWEPGARAVVFMEVKKVAEERGVTPRQINTYERDIAEAFGLVAVKSCNGRRYGQRDPETGKIVHAFGFELTGIKDALPDLRQAKAELDTMKTMRAQRAHQLRIERARVRQLANAVAALHDTPQSVRDMAAAIVEPHCERVTDRQLTDMQELERLLVAAWRAESELEALLLMGKTCGGDGETSDRSEENFRHLQARIDSQSSLTGCSSPRVDSTTRQPAGAVRETRPAGLSRKPPAGVGVDADADYDGPAAVSGTGAERIKPGLAMQAASERFRAHAPLNRRPSPSDVVDGARSLLPELGVDGSTWRYACQIIGPYPAALAVLIADRAALDRGIDVPGAYLRGMVRRAIGGALALDRSVFGLVNG